MRYLTRKQTIKLYRVAIDLLTNHLIGVFVDQVDVVCTGFVFRPAEDDDNQPDDVTFILAAHGTATENSQAVGNLSVTLPVVLPPETSYDQAVMHVIKTGAPGCSPIVQ